MNDFSLGDIRPFIEIPFFMILVAACFDIL